MRRAPNSIVALRPLPRGPRRTLALWVAALLVAVAVVGCGSGGGSSSQGGTSSTKAGTSTTTSTKQAHEPKPIGPPPQKETFAAAQKRIASVVASGDCDKINALTVSAHKNADQQKLQKSCAKLKKALGRSKPSGAQSFKGLAGVLDYATRKRNRSAVFLRTADGLYHLAYFDRFESGPTVGTPFAHEFDARIQAAFDALRTKNCDAYLKVAYVVTGPASKGKENVCPRLSKNAVAKAVEKTPSAKPKLIGGNRFFAFYGLDGRNYLTLSMAREAASQRPPGLKPGVMVLPKGAAEYAFVGAFRTNEHKPPS